MRQASVMRFDLLARVHLLLGLFVIVAAMAISTPLALADPTGSYRVEGRNPDNNATYTGTVQVTRKGDTYEVIWVIGGTRFVGTGLGAVLSDGRVRVGAANAQDRGISIGYVSADTFGIAMYFLQDDGTWEGVWTYAGSGEVTKEIWFAR